MHNVKGSPKYFRSFLYKNILGTGGLKVDLTQLQQFLVDICNFFVPVENSQNISRFSLVYESLCECMISQACMRIFH